MKFLCDVHIPYKLNTFLKSNNHESIHVNDILDKWFTKDKDISKYADDLDLVLITKDLDFKNSFLINKTPKKLLKVNLGNINTQKLIEIIGSELESIEKLNNSFNSFMVEINNQSSTFIKG